MLSKSADETTFSLKLNVVQATEVNLNKHLLVLNILSSKYSLYDVKCDVNYCVYFAIWVDDQRIRVSANENHRIFNTRSSTNNLIYKDAVVYELMYMQNSSAFLMYEAIY